MSPESDRIADAVKKMFHARAVISLLVLTLTVAAIIVGCSSGSSTSTTAPGMATASVMLSDPSTCMAPNGPYSHVYITVTDIKAHVNANAGDSDPGWVDLTPNLSKGPAQVDLLGLANNQCFLATLGAPLQLQAGNYQQIRVILADNASNNLGKSNACMSSANCVVLNDGSVYPLQLSSEAKTGIKIPSGQIANGGFNIAAGQTKDLDIDFNTCVSIVREGNGQYRLKPVLHAGEVSTTSSSINGTVVDSGTGKPISGQVTVALEQKDATGIDRIFMSTLTDASGNFVFCPLPSGSYDVVIVGQSSTGVVYSPDVITGVSTGSAVSVVQLHALPVVSLSASTLQGQVTSQNGATPVAGTVADLQLSTLEVVNSGLTVTVPLAPSFGQSGATLAASTASSNSCPSGTDCLNYSLKVTAGPVFAGAFTAGGTTLTQSTLPASYAVDVVAFVPSSGGLLDCSTSELKSPVVTPVAGTVVLVSPLALTGCQ